MTTQHPTNNDDLLEIAVDHLKNMSIPEMPQQHGKQHLHKQAPPKRWPLVAAGLSAIAASVVIVSVSFRQERIPDNNQPTPEIIANRTSEIVEIDFLNPNESLDRYIAQLNQLEQEIILLKKKARLLDARRKAEQLILHFATAKLTNSTLATMQPN